jgi:hypothetical protein
LSAIALIAVGCGTGEVEKDAGSQADAGPEEMGLPDGYGASNECIEDSDCDGLSEGFQPPGGYVEGSSCEPQGA